MAAHHSWYYIRAPLCVPQVPILSVPPLPRAYFILIVCGLKRCLSVATKAVFTTAAIMYRILEWEALVSAPDLGFFSLMAWVQGSAQEIF